jgi:peroxiredoxin
MTQAELAYGMANGPQARPAKGQLIRDFTLTSTLGQPISLSDYRGRSNLVLVFAAGGDGSPDLKILAEIAADYARFLDEQTQVLAIMQCTQAKAARIKEEANLPFPLLVDEDGRIHRRAGAADNYGHPAIAIYIADRFGEVFGAYRAAVGTHNARLAGDCDLASIHQQPVSGMQYFGVASLTGLWMNWT